jgi:hypothetical protein
MHCGNRVKLTGVNVPVKMECLGHKTRSHGRNLLQLLRLRVVRPVTPRQSLEFSDPFADLAEIVELSNSDPAARFGARN